MFCIIVDGYSTGAGLAKEFTKEGLECIHVQSQASVPKVYNHTYNSNDYLEHYIFNGSAETLIENLLKYAPDFVIAGAECGIELADHLAEALGLIGNGIALSSSRRNKYLMLERIKSCNLNVIPSCCASSLEEATAWTDQQKPHTIIVKPLNSAGGEGVRICQSIKEIKEACNEIFATKINMLGFKNRRVLLQHYIGGKEFVVNTVSYDGMHKLCELWQYTRYKRPNGRQIYDTATLIDYNPELHKTVVDYAYKVINALGIKYGPAHVEIIANEKGCFLIELGARLMGANLPFELLSKCVSTSQALSTVTAYTKPGLFKQSLSTPYKILQPLTALFMVSNQEGIIERIDHTDDIRQCQSFFDIKLSLQTGDRIYNTIDYQTSPGMIYLSHHNQEQIDNDIKQIRALEKNIFKLTDKQVLQNVTYYDM